MDWFDHRADDMILEGLLTTVTDEGTLHVAPMGPIVDAEYRTLLLRPFPSSNTYRHLRKTGEGVFHVTDDARLIALAALGAMPTNLRTRPARFVQGFILSDCCRAYEFRVRHLDESQDRIHIQADVLGKLTLREFVGFNRAKHAVLEAAILATRFHLLNRDEVATEFRKLHIIVDKTGADPERDAMLFLESRFQDFYHDPVQP